jgi:hypothetical protein
MRVKVLFLTSGIRTVLSCSLNISCSSPSHASLGPQPAVGTLAVPAHPSSPAQTSSSSSEAAPSPRSSPPLACHVRRTVSALGCLERVAPAGGRGCRDRGTRASGGRDCSDSGKDGKASDGGTGSSKGRSRSSSGGGCSACRARQSSRPCAPVAPVALFLLMTTEKTSSSWRGRQHGSKRRSGQPRIPRGTRR